MQSERSDRSVRGSLSDCILVRFVHSLQVSDSKLRKLARLRHHLWFVTNS